MPRRNYLMLVFFVFCLPKASLDERIQMKVIGKINKYNTSTFECAVTSKPLSCHVDIMVDNSTKDYVRLTQGKCVNRKGKCKPNQCSCSSDCMDFTWRSNENMLSNQIVSFSMKFQAEDSDGGYIKRTAGVVFTGAEYIQLGFSNQLDYQRSTLNTTEYMLGYTRFPDGKQKTDNTADNLIYLCIALSVIGIIVTLAMCRYQNYCSCQRKKDSYSDIYKDTKF